MHPSTPPAERALRAAFQTLNEHLLALGYLRQGLARMRLPLPAAEDYLDHSDDLCAMLTTNLNRAAGVMEREIERLQDAAEVEYARTHGLLALAAANDNPGAEAA